MDMAYILFKYIIIVLLGIMLLILLMINMFLNNRLACRINANVFNLATLNNELTERQIPKKLDTTLVITDCQEKAWAQTRWLLSIHQNRQAIDFWQRHENINKRSVALFPKFFQYSLSARQGEQAGDWTLALAAYRQMFQEARQKGGLPLDEMNTEYQKALIGWYENQDNLGAAEQLRHALWLWRADNPRTAIKILEQVQASNLSPRLRSKIEAYRLLIEADKLQSERKAVEALQVLVQIPASEQAIFLRALLQIASLEERDSTTIGIVDWRPLLSNWKPSVPVNYKPDSAFAELVGFELLEPELLEDGGWTEFALFWDTSAKLAKVEPEAAGWNVVNERRSIQVVQILNLIPNPGFEWKTTDMTGLSAWRQEQGTLASVTLEQRHLHNELTYAACLKNDKTFSSINLLETFFLTNPNNLYLAAAWIQNQGSNNATFWKRWIKTDGSIRFKWLISGQLAESFNYYADIEQAEENTVGTVVGLQNLGANSAVCFDNIFFGSLPSELNERLYP
jgi:hypothetical protein